MLHFSSPCKAVLDSWVTASESFDAENVSNFSAA